MPRPLTRWLSLALLGAAASCASRTAADEAGALASFAATVEIAADHWAAGSLPAHFADDALAHVQRLLALEARKIDRVKSTPDTVTALRQALAEADRTVAQARAAVQSGTPSFGREASARAAHLRTALQR